MIEHPARIVGAVTLAVRVDHRVAHDEVHLQPGDHRGAVELAQGLQGAQTGAGGGGADDGEAVDSDGGPQGAIFEQLGEDSQGAAGVAEVGEGGDEGVVGDEVSHGHFVEQAEGAGEGALGSGERGEEGVVGVGVLEGEVAERRLRRGGLRRGGGGVEGDEAVGEEGVVGEGGFEEEGVEGAAAAEVGGRDEEVEEGEDAVDGDHGDGGGGGGGDGRRRRRAWSVEEEEGLSRGFAVNVHFV